MENKHLLGLENTTANDIKHFIKTGFIFREVLDRPIKKIPSLTGKNIVNLFFENSTRTRISFELAEKRLSSDIDSAGPVTVITVIPHTPRRLSVAIVNFFCMNY